MICSYVCRIYHSSLLRYCLLCARFQAFILSKLTAGWTIARSHYASCLVRSSCAAAQWRCSVRSINAILWSPSTGLVCHSPEMNWGSSGIVRNSHKFNKWRRHLGSDLNFGPVQNEHLVVRTYDRWPLRASGFLGPLARLARRVKNNRRTSRPVVNVEAWDYIVKWCSSLACNWEYTAGYIALLLTLILMMSNQM